MSLEFLDICSGCLIPDIMHDILEGTYTLYTCILHVACTMYYVTYIQWNLSLWAPLI